MEEGEEEAGDRTDLEVDETTDGEAAAPEGLGAVGQLAAAVVVVAVLVLIFMGGSAVLRRVFG